MDTALDCIIALARAFLDILHAQKPAIQKTNSGFAHGPGLPNTEIFQLLRAESTVHDDVLARGECRPGRTEPEDGAGNLLGRSDAANRGFCHVVFFISVSPSPKARSNISVWIRPGDTLLTRTPCPANSSAADLVRPMTANLLAA